jgi:putative methyltransferase (TIGR04325 family)
LNRSDTQGRHPLAVPRDLLDNAEFTYGEEAANVSDRVRRVLRNLVPPVAVRGVRKVTPGEVGRGNDATYETWEEACANAVGYPDPGFVDRLAASALKVKRGEAVYERDSVLFDSIQYSWPVLAGLLWAASSSGNTLNVLDFGGSLGTSYYQNRAFLEHIRDLRWNIVELPHFVRRGRDEFETAVLRFHESIEECLEETTPNVLLVSGSLQYLENPYSFLDAVAGHCFPYLIFDRTPFLSDRDQLTVERYPRHIHDSSYPAWRLNERRFHSLLDEKSYSLVAEFDRTPDKDIKGFIFRLKSE